MGNKWWVRIIFSMLFVLSCMSALAESTPVTDAETGFMYRVENGQAVVLGIDKEVEKLIIPSQIAGYPVRSVGGFFWSAGANLGHSLIELEIEEGVSEVEDYTFNGCMNLKKVILPDSVTRIGISAFSCENLSEIRMPAEITLDQIGEDAFWKVHIPDIVLSDGTSLLKASTDPDHRVFAGWENDYYFSLTQDETITILGTSLPENSTELTIPEKLAGYPVTTLEDYAFNYYYAQLEIVHLPDGLKEIGERAFYRCLSLHEINIPSSVEKIGASAFAGVAMEQPEIPEGVELPVTPWYWKGWNRSGDWEYGILADNTAILLSYWNESDIPAVWEFPAMIDEYPVTVIQAGVNYSSSSALTAVIIPEGVQILNGQFRACNNLSSVVLPSTLRVIGDHTFGWDFELQEIDFPQNLTYIGRGAFIGCHIKTVVLPDSIEYIGAENFTVGVEKLHLPENVKHIGKEAFVNHRLANIYIPASVQEIEDGAFQPSEDSRINTVIIQGKDTVFGKGVFGYTWDYKSEYEYDDPRSLTDNYAEDNPDASGTIKMFCYPDSTADRLYNYRISKSYDVEQAVSDVAAGLYDTRISGDFEYALVGDGTAKLIKYPISQGNIVIPSEVDGIPVSVIQKNNDFTSEDKDKVKQLKIGDGVRVIEKEAFSNMRGLNNITLPDSLEVIEERVFKNCTVSKVTLPKAMRIVGKEAFYDCPLSKIIFSDVLEEIGDYAFYGHKANDFSFPASLRSIGIAAFKPESLPKSGIKATFANLDIIIGKGVFGYDDGFRAYNRKHRNDDEGTVSYYDSDNPDNWTDYYADASNYDVPEIKITCYPGSTPDLLYQYHASKNYLKWNEENVWTAPADTVLLSGPASEDVKIYEIVVPEGVEEIASDAFAGMKTLNRITLPSSLIRIGDRAFAGCSSLQDISNMPKSVSSIGEEAFADCIQLGKITLADEMSEIANATFKNCKLLSKITLPKKGLTRIGNYAFSGCEALTSFQFNKGLKEIGEYAFENTGLRQAQIQDLPAILGEGVFAGSSISSINLPQGINDIPNSFCAFCVNLKSVNLPKGVSRIGDNAFLGCRSLANVTFPEGLISIGEKAFLQNAEAVQFYHSYSEGKKKYTALSSIKLPASLQTIGALAFGACDALTGVTFATKDPQLKDIGDGAFTMCAHLREINFPNSLEQIGNDVFVNCLDLSKVNFGNMLTKTGDSVFKFCSALTSLIVPDSLTEIGNNMFEECSEKLTVTCGEGSAMETYLHTLYPDVNIAYPKK